MKHYNWYSISSDAQTTTHHLFKTVAFVAETFVFVYLGMNVTGFYSFHLKWDPVLIVFSLIACLVSRMVNIFPLSFIANLGRKNKISFKMQIMVWFAGLRGAIAFALALNMRTSHRSEVITTTLFLVLFTTIILGSSTSFVLKTLDLDASESVREDECHSRLLFISEGSEEERNRFKKRPEKISWAHRTWRRWDEKLMKPLFGGQPRYSIE